MNDRPPLIRRLAMLGLILCLMSGCVSTPNAIEGYELDTTPDENGEHYR